MKGKVIPLKQRGDGGVCRDDGEPAGGAEALLAVPMQEVDRILWQASARTPAVLRGRLLAIAERGERVCPALFLLITSADRDKTRSRYRLAASLEALHLALETHRDIVGTGDMSQKEAILCGDFFFGLALTLAGHQSLFIQGMSEVITRFAAGVINMPDEPADVGDPREHLQRICDGSASIFALSCSLGASFGGLKPRCNEALSYYGLYLGISLELKREAEKCKQSLRERKPVSCGTLPLIYTLGKSPLRKKLVQILGGSPSDGEYEILLKEVRRANPWLYTEKIIDNCTAKAYQSIELLHETVDSTTTDLLKSYLY